MEFCRYTDRRTPTWSLVTGTAKSGYPVTALGDLDPSAPLWIDETTIRVVADMGSALEVQGIGIFAHNFDQALTVKLQANGSNVWTAPSLSVDLTIEPAYRDGFACDVWFNLTHSFSSRTYRYWSITNAGDPNSVSIAIGEIWLASTVRQLSNTDLAHDYQRRLQHLVTASTSKRGVQTVYDMGSRARGLMGHVRATSDQLDEILDWDDDQHGSARPMVVVLDPEGESQRVREPHMARFQGVEKAVESMIHDRLYDVSLAFEEMGRGELVG